MGCAFNLNRGIELAKGKYIGINYSDDFVEKGFYKKMLQVAIEEDADVVCANIADYNDKTQKIIYNDITTSNIYYSIYKDSITLKDVPFEVTASFLLGHWTASSASTKIIRKEFYEKYKFYGSKANDVSAIYPILADAKKIVYYPNLYLFYREVENSLSRANDIESYNSVGETMLKTFQLMNDIKGINDEKEVLFFNNCLNYLFYVLNKISDKDMRKNCIKDYIKKLHIYDVDIFNKMKKSKYYNYFLVQNKISEESYDLLQEERINEFIYQKSLEDKIFEQKSEILNLDQENKLRLNEIQVINKDRTNLNKFLEDSNKNVEKLEKEIQELIMQKKNLEEQLERKVQELTRQIEVLEENYNILEYDLKNKIKEKDNIIARYENSLSWKVTRPIRKMRSFIKKK